MLKVKGFSEVKVEKIKEAIGKCQVNYLSCLVLQWLLPCQFCPAECVADQAT